MSTQLPERFDTCVTWRYLPRPIGQRARTPLMTLVYSFTRPLILLIDLDTFTFLPVKMAGMVDAPMPRPSALWGFTADRLATVARRSPREDRFLPWPLMTYIR